MPRDPHEQVEQGLITSSHAQELARKEAEKEAARAAGRVLGLEGEVVFDDVPPLSDEEIDNLGVREEDGGEEGYQTRDINSKYPGLVLEAMKSGMPMEDYLKDIGPGDDRWITAQKILDDIDAVNPYKGMTPDEVKAYISDQNLGDTPGILDLSEDEILDPRFGDNQRAA